MKRNKKGTKKEETKIVSKPRWKMKDGCGSHFMPNGMVVKPGNVIKAFPDELAGALDKFIPIDAYEKSVMNEEPFVPASTLTIIHKGSGKYNVVNESGEAINDKLLTKTQAESLLNGIPGKVEEDEEEENPVIKLSKTAMSRKKLGGEVTKKKDKKSSINIDHPAPIPIVEKIDDGEDD